MKIKLLLLCCAVFLTTSCASTKVISTWKDDSQTEKFTTVFVFGLAQQQDYRSLLEHHLVDLLEDAGVKAYTTYDLFPDITSIDKAAANSVIKKNSGDGVIWVRLQKKKEESLYHRGETVFVGGITVDDSSGWYSYYETVSTPDYVVDHDMEILETVIYNVDPEKRVWSLVTKTTAVSIPDVIYLYSMEMRKQLKSSGLF
jgi:hypothetical protein